MPAEMAHPFEFRRLDLRLTHVEPGPDDKPVA